MKTSGFTTSILPTQLIMNQALDGELSNTPVNFLMDIDHEIPNMYSIRIPIKIKLLVKNRELIDQ